MTLDIGKKSHACGNTYGELQNNVFYSIFAKKFLNISDLMVSLVIFIYFFKYTHE